MALILPTGDMILTLTMKVFRALTIPRSTSLNVEKARGGREGGEWIAIHSVGPWRIKAVVMLHGSPGLLGSVILCQVY